MRAQPLSHALGAEIVGVDLTRPISDSDFSEIHRLFLEHCILLFRNQKLTREQHVAFSRRFGELDDNDRSPDTDPEYPELTIVTTRPKPDGTPSESRYTGQVWHSDLCFSLTPAMGSLLRCVELPSVGGDTMFANMYLAYDTLSDGMKKLLVGLDGIHARQRKFADVSAERAPFLKRQRPVAQPVVRVHPETGRKTLYLGEKVKQLVGLTPEESQPLIDYVNRHSTRPQFVYRHQWKTDDLILWDNRCTLHLAVGDFDDTQFRHMERTTVKGTPSGYVYEQA
jgi:taurine dioxygenase